ncbi:MAG TPA: TadE/TadG family type IV pilus assembly protein [Variovorax sp.]|nr:TadE/TadG family type IV pilus assembly protein [Variovorax sp.]
MSTRGRQRGVAAVEFALVLTLLLALVHGIVTLGSILYLQQAIARAAEDGVRAVALMPNGATPDAQRVGDIVFDTLAGSLVVPAANAATFASRRAWVTTHVQVAVAASGGVVTVSVTHWYSDNPLMPMAGMPWVPDAMTRQASMVLPAQPT